jgi:glycosyltransferase involved in cell wall biosynthesis
VPRRRPRVLFVSARHPNPPLRGDQLRPYHLLRVLAQRVDLTLLTFGTGPPLPFEGVRVESVGRGPLAAVGANLARPDPLLPLQVRLYLSSVMARAVRRTVSDWDPDVVHVTLSRMAPYMPGPGTAHRHLDLVDSLSLNMRTRAAGSPPGMRQALLLEARLLERYEARAAAAADTVSLVSGSDRRARGLERAAVIPLGIDFDAMPFEEPLDRPPVLLFFGNLGYFHNVEPARFVATEVLPIVREQLPDARLRIAGARPAGTVRGLAPLPGVDLVGPVADMGAELRGAAAAVLPMFTGSGLKTKVLEAFASGTPVVTNALGVQGVEGATPGRHYLEAESAGSMAQAAVRLLTSVPDRVALGRAAADLARASYTWERAGDALLELYGLEPLSK